MLYPELVHNTYNTIFGPAQDINVLRILIGANIKNGEVILTNKSFFSAVATFNKL